MTQVQENSLEKPYKVYAVFYGDEEPHLITSYDEEDTALHCCAALLKSKHFVAKCYVN